MAMCRGWSFGKDRNQSSMSLRAILGLLDGQVAERNGFKMRQYYTVMACDNNTVISNHFLPSCLECNSKNQHQSPQMAIGTLAAPGYFQRVESRTTLLAIR